MDILRIIFLTMVSLVFIALGAGLFIAISKFWLKIIKISRNGVQTDGEIIEMVTIHKTRSKARYPLVRFATLEKEWFTEIFSISTIPGILKKGQRVTVVYHSGNPREFFLRSPFIQIIPVILFAFGILILVCGIYTMLYIKY
jgi:hypothetical protein